MFCFLALLAKRRYPKHSKQICRKNTHTHRTITQDTEKRRNEKKCDYSKHHYLDNTTLIHGKTTHECTDDLLFYGPINNISLMPLEGNNTFKRYNYAHFQYPNRCQRSASQAIVTVRQPSKRSNYLSVTVNRQVSYSGEKTFKADPVLLYNND